MKKILKLISLVLLPFSLQQTHAMNIVRAAALKARTKAAPAVPRIASRLTTVQKSILPAALRVNIAKRAALSSVGLATALTSISLAKAEGKKSHSATLFPNHHFGNFKTVDDIKQEKRNDAELNATLATLTPQEEAAINEFHEITDMIRDMENTPYGSILYAHEINTAYIKREAVFKQLIRSLNPLHPVDYEKLLDHLYWLERNNPRKRVITIDAHVEHSGVNENLKAHEKELAACFKSGMNTLRSSCGACSSRADRAQEVACIDIIQKVHPSLEALPPTTPWYKRIFSPSNELRTSFTKDIYRALYNPQVICNNLELTTTPHTDSTIFNVQAEITVNGHTKEKPISGPFFDTIPFSATVKKALEDAQKKDGDKTVTYKKGNKLTIKKLDVTTRPA